MAVSENKVLARRWFEEVWNQQRKESIARMLAPDVITHGIGPDGSPVKGVEAFTAFQHDFVTTFPDLKVTVEDLIAEDDRVAIRWRATGTMTGGGLKLAPTGRPISMTGISIVRVRDGQIVEGWNNFDLLGMHRQTGTLSQLL